MSNVFAESSIYEPKTYVNNLKIKFDPFLPHGYIQYAVMTWDGTDLSELKFLPEDKICLIYNFY